MERSIAVVATIACFVSAALPIRAQGAAATIQQRVDSTTHKLPVDASRIQPAQFTYRLSILRDSVTEAIGDQRFSISTLDYAAAPALLLARDGAQGVASAADSIVVRRDDLRPLHWIAAHGVARVAVEFTLDSIYGAMTSPLGRQNIVLPNRGDLLVNMMSVDAVVASLPLAPAWRDSASLLAIDAGGAAITPVTLMVEGEEHIAVPSGEYDCWIVSLETERGSERLWVTKQGQIVVRAEQVLPELGGATLSRVLVQSDSPALPVVSSRAP
jgi:hypothetical protein